VAEGPAATHVLAFARRYRGQLVVSVATRLSAALLGNTPLPHVPPAVWEATTLALPRVEKARRWRDVLTGKMLDAAGDQVPLGAILSRLPVALLEAA
jgi:(1->4)-alpha-D-glucan 1-alpha-D-glucosylmutase